MARRTASSEGGLPPVILVFGEDKEKRYDQQALAYLVEGLCKKAPPVRPRRTPLTLVRGVTKEKAKKNAEKAAAIVRAEADENEVVLVIAHEDCDAVELASKALAEEIEGLWGPLMPCPVVAATPASMTEAWWFLFPDAVAAVNSEWKRLSDTPGDTGMIDQAATKLKAALVPAKGKKPRPYQKKQSPDIAKYVRDLGLVRKPKGKSASYVRFANRITWCLCPPKGEENKCRETQGTR